MVEDGEVDGDEVAEDDAPEGVGEVGVAGEVDDEGGEAEFFEGFRVGGEGGGG